MATFTLELVSPEQLLFTGEVESVVVPGSEGEFTVLKDHAPMMSTLKPGLVTIVEASTQRRLFVRGGFADVNPAGLTILAETAVPIEDLDAARFDAEIKAANDDVAGASTDDGRRLAQTNLDQLRNLRSALSL